MSIENKTLTYSKTSVSEHLYLVNTSCLNAYLSPPDQFLLQIDLYLVNNSQLWTMNTIFGPCSKENL